MTRATRAPGRPRRARREIPTSRRRARGATLVRRIGIFGGTFDPPHLGHLVIAERTRDQLALSRVVFVPAADPPHKQGRRLSPMTRRVAMTRLAVRGAAAFGVSDLEARRPGPSYTVETLEAFRRMWPEAELVLILGEDSLDDFGTWRDPRRILALARLAVAPRLATPPRRGSPPPRAPRVPGLARRVAWIDAPRIELASSDLRARAARGASLRYLVPDAVAAYIARHRLYR